MNEQIKEKLIEYLNYLETAAKSATDVAAAELPLVIQEYITWLQAECIVFAIGTLAVVGLIIYAARCMVSYASIPNNLSADDSFFTTVAGNIIQVAASIIGLLLLSSNFMTLAKCYFAPRVVIIEKLMEMVN